MLQTIECEGTVIWILDSEGAKEPEKGVTYGLAASITALFSKPSFESKARGTFGPGRSDNAEIDTSCGPLISLGWKAKSYRRHVFCKASGIRRFEPGG